ncbi:HNH endonuclease [Intrasporangium sp.]|uniref:HNH endonuclease signature motif containing protein n=1 Tax=Intrasporangium sp. TaxID=1925024 RepID=UPI00293A0BDE|nr:HNH endonuclease [Intrasporangium sp.]MDV3219918.1 HNH endonuclease [Intrasporangium sp.]
MPFTAAALSPFEHVLARGAAHDATSGRGRVVPLDLAWLDLREAEGVEVGWDVVAGHDEPSTEPTALDQAAVSDQAAVTAPSGVPAPGQSAEGLSLEQASAALLAEIEALEAERSRVDARLVEAYGALHTVMTEQHAAHDAQLPEGFPRESPAEAAVSVGQLVAHEVVAATAVPAGEASRRLRLAAAPRRHRSLLDRLAVGAVSLHHATLIATDARHLPDDVIGSVVERVLAPMRDGSRPSHQVIVRRLRRVLASLSPADSGGRRGDALSRRSAHGQLDEHGTGVITITTSAERTVAILERIETLARALRAAGDPRTLDQLRSDLATDGLLGHTYGPCAEHSAHEAASGRPPTADSAAPGDETPRAVALAPCRPSHAEPITAATGEPGPCPCAPTAPPATVWIVVPFEVATGAGDAACEIPGHGWVTAEQARAIITAPGSEWRWLGVDALTGRALHLSTDRYRPTPAIVEQIRALDGHCRGPGCQVPAHRCDIDHHVPYPGGETSTRNGGPLHRAHHNLKTARFWSCVPTDDHATTRGLLWRTLAGRDYTTFSKDYREALDDPRPPRPPRRPWPPPPDEPPPF